MQYNAFKVRNVLVWLAVQTDAAAYHQIWPVLFLAERKHLALTGEWICGDILVAMACGPVPLRTYTELRLNAGQWTGRSGETALNTWLKRMAIQAHIPSPACEVTESERQCLKWASQEAKRLGFAALKQAVCGRAWQRAGPDGELDPLEVALEGGADAATLDHILRWRDGYG